MDAYDITWRQKNHPIGGDTAAPINTQKRISLILKHVNLLHMKILDCGCGKGLYVVEFLNFGCDAIGIDYSKEKIEQGRRLHPEIAFRLSVGDIERLDFPDGSLDIVMLNEVLEHIENQGQALKEIYRILKPDGQLIVFSPNRLYPFETHSVISKFSQKIIPHYIPFIPYIPVKIGNLFFDYRARNYWPCELKQLITRQGFKIIQTDFVWQTFENISGNLPRRLEKWIPLLRKLVAIFEVIPGIKVFGVTQLIISTKANH